MTDTDPAFTFVDLFAGIGGFRCGLEQVGGRCVYSSEWDKYSAQTYQAWHGEDVVQDDFREIDYSTIPDHEVLTAGFPCQPFSLAGVSKKNWLGRPHGFDDAKQGNLFEYIMKLVDTKGGKRPPVLFMENVKNLLSHDRGKTWREIYRQVSMRDYHVFYEVIDAKPWVPQHRERVYMVCCDMNFFGNDRTAIDFTFPEPPDRLPVLAEVLEDEPAAKYMLSDRLWQYHQDYAEKHRRNGNGFGFGLAEADGQTRTLSARYYKDGAEILYKQPGWQRPRRLTPTECGRLMGFDQKYVQNQVVSDSRAYMQYGNAVVPQIVAAIGHEIVRVLTSVQSDAAGA